jgi:hypothetical protein
LIVRDVGLANNTPFTVSLAVPPAPPEPSAAETEYDPL